MQTPAYGRTKTSFTGLGKSTFQPSSQVDTFLSSNLQKSRNLESALKDPYIRLSGSSYMPTSGIDSVRQLALQQQQEYQSQPPSSTYTTFEQKALQSEIERLKRKLNSVISTSEDVLSDVSTAQAETNSHYETQLSQLDAQINTLYADNSFLRRKLEAALRDYETEKKKVRSLGRELEQERAKSAGFPPHHNDPTRSTGTLSESSPLDDQPSAPLPAATLNPSASSEDGRLRKLVIHMQDEMDRRESLLSTATQARVLAEAQLAAARIETVHSLTLLQQLTRAQEATERRRVKYRRQRQESKTHFSPETKGGDWGDADVGSRETGANNSVMEDSLEININDLHSSPGRPSFSKCMDIARDLPSQSAAALASRRKAAHETVAMLEINPNPSQPSTRLEEVHEIWRSASDGVMPLSELLEKLAHRVAEAVECIEGTDAACEEEKGWALDDIRSELAQEIATRRRLEAKCRIQADALDRMASLEMRALQGDRVPALTVELETKTALIAKLEASLAALSQVEDQRSHTHAALASLQVQYNRALSTLEERDFSLQEFMRSSDEKIRSLERDHESTLSELRLHHEDTLHSLRHGLDEQVYLLKQQISQDARDLETALMRNESDKNKLSEDHSHQISKLAAVEKSLREELTLLKTTLADQVAESVKNYNLQAVVAGERDNALALAQQREHDRHAMIDKFNLDHHQLSLRIKQFEAEHKTLAMENHDLLLRVRSHDEVLQQTVQQLKQEFAQKYNALEMRNRGTERELHRVKATLEVVEKASQAMTDDLGASKDQHEQAIAQVREQFQAEKLINEMEISRLKAEHSETLNQLAVVRAEYETPGSRNTHRSEVHSRRAALEGQVADLTATLQKQHADNDTLRVETLAMQTRLATADQAVASAQAAKLRLELQLQRCEDELAHCITKHDALSESNSLVATERRIAVSAMEDLQSVNKEQEGLLNSLKIECVAAQEQLSVANRSLASMETALRISKNEYQRLRMAHESMAADNGALRAEVDSLTVAIAQIRGKDKWNENTDSDDLERSILTLRLQRDKDVAAIARLTEDLQAAIRDREQATSTLLQVDHEVASMWSNENKALAEQVSALERVIMDKDAIILSHTGDVNEKINELEISLAVERSERRISDNRLATALEAESSMCQERNNLMNRCHELEAECNSYSVQVAALTSAGQDMEREQVIRLRAQGAEIAELRAELAGSCQQQSSLEERLAAVSSHSVVSETQSRLLQQRVDASAARIVDLESRLREHDATAASVVVLRELAHDRAALDADISSLTERVAGLTEELAKEREQHHVTRSHLEKKHDEVRHWIPAGSHVSAPISKESSPHAHRTPTTPVSATHHRAHDAHGEEFVDLSESSFYSLDSQNTPIPTPRKHCDHDSVNYAHLDALRATLEQVQGEKSRVDILLQGKDAHLAQALETAFRAENGLKESQAECLQLREQLRRLAETQDQQLQLRIRESETSEFAHQEIVIDLVAQISHLQDDLQASHALHASLVAEREIDLLRSVQLLDQHQSVTTAQNAMAVEMREMAAANKQHVDEKAKLLKNYYSRQIDGLKGIIDHLEAEKADLELDSKKLQCKIDFLYEEIAALKAAPPVNVPVHFSPSPNTGRSDSSPEHHEANRDIATFAVELGRCTVPALKDKLRSRGLPVSGLKSELIARLVTSERSRESGKLIVEPPSTCLLQATMDFEEIHDKEHFDADYHPAVVFDFDDVASESSTQHAARQTDQEIQRLREANATLETENTKLSTKIDGLLEVNKQLTHGQLAASASHSWAIKAVQFSGYEGDDGMTPFKKLGSASTFSPTFNNRTPVSAQSIKGPFSLSPSAAADTPGAKGHEDDLPSELSVEQLREQLIVARRNAKTSTAAAHKVSSEAQHQLRALRNELTDITGRYTEMLAQNETLTTHLHAAEEEYNQASRTLIETAEKHRKSQHIKIEQLQNKVATAKDLTRKLVGKVRFERARHKEEVSALQAKLRDAATAAGLEYEEDGNDDGIIGLERDSDAGSVDSSDSLTSSFSISAKSNDV